MSIAERHHHPVTVPKPHLPAWSTRAIAPVGLVVFLFWYLNGPGAQRSWLDLGVEATYLAAVALGVNLLTGYTGLLSLGHAGFFVVGGYTGAVWAPAWGLSPWLGLPFAFVFGAAMGALLALLCCHLRGFYLTVVTLAFGGLLPALVTVLKSTLGGPTGRSVTAPIDTSILPLANGDAYRGLFVLSAICLFVTLWLCRNLVHSKWGRASMAIRESELAASSSGIETYIHKVSAFAMSAGIVSVAGVIGAERFLLVSPGAGSQEQSFRYVIMIALGGLGTLAGPILGAFALTFGFGLTWVQQHLVNQQNLVFGLLGLIGVALAPDGTMGNINKLLTSIRHRHLKNAQPRSFLSVASANLPVRVAPTASGLPALELAGLTKRFGGVVAVNDVDFVVEQGEVHGLIGPNGSGKTTLLNMISGIATPSAGRVIVMGHDDTKSSAAKRSGLGVSRTFQNLQLWKKMTVRDNVLVGCHRDMKVNMVQAALGTRGCRRAERAAAQRADELLALVGLAERADDLAGALPFAEQRRLEIARALAASPYLLLLDEPAAGLHPGDVHDLLALIRTIKTSGVSVILVEHHMELLMAVSDVITVLEFGSTIAEGTPSEVQNNPAVIAAYLGVEEEVA